MVSILPQDIHVFSPLLSNMYVSVHWRMCDLHSFWGIGRKKPGCKRLDACASNNMCGEPEGRVKLMWNVEALENSINSAWLWLLRFDHPLVTHSLPPNPMKGAETKRSLVEIPIEILCRYTILLVWWENLVEAAPHRLAVRPRGAAHRVAVATIRRVVAF